MGGARRGSRGLIWEIQVKQKVTIMHLLKRSPAVLLCTVLLLLPNSILAQSANEQNLVVMFVPQSREAFITSPRRAHCFVRHLSLESFSCRNWTAVGDSNKGVWAVDHNWKRHNDGTITCTGQVTENVPYQLSMAPNLEFVEIRVSVTNNSVITFHDLYAHMCLHVRENPLMYDPSMERTFVQINNERIAMNQTDTADSIGGVMPAYFPRAVSPEDRWLPERLRSYGWAISGDVVDSPLAAIVSKDGRSVVGLWFEPFHYVIGNCRKPYHGCIHSEPSFGTLDPGQTASATGRLYVSNGTIEEVWKEMNDDWQQLCKDKY